MKIEDSKEAAGTLKLIKKQNSDEFATGADNELGFPQTM